MIFSCLVSISSLILFTCICMNPDAQNAFGQKRLLLLPDFFLLNSDFYASVAGILALTLFSTLTCFRLFFLFEKTPSVEITFFSAGIVSVSLESVRLFVPMYHLTEGKLFLVDVLSRTVFFSRIFFILTILAGAIFSFEKKLQQTGTVLFMLAFIAFLAAQSLPVNYSEPTSLFFMPPGYLKLLVFICLFLGVTTILSFVFQYILKNDKAYLGTAAGTFLMSAGWTLLGLCDNWIFFAAGTVLQIVGTEKYLRSLHASYLWQ